MSDDEESAMAAAMGFSAFGHKPAAKKRKFNPTTDAFVEGQALESLDRGGSQGKGSGGNTIPLGRMRELGAKKGGTERTEGRDEELGMGKGRGRGMMKLPPTRTVEAPGESEEEGPNYIDTSRSPPAFAGNFEDGPQYIDTSEAAPITSYHPPNIPSPVPGTAETPVSDEEAIEMQRRVAALLASLEPVAPSGQEGTNLPERPAFTPNSNYGDTAFMQGGSRGGTSERGSQWGGSRRGGSERGGSERGGGRGGSQWVGSSRGERNDKWYIGYYDPAFNANPWERLEKERGLEALGNWVEVPGNQGRGGQRA